MISHLRSRRGGHDGEGPVSEPRTPELGELQRFVGEWEPAGQAAEGERLASAAVRLILSGCFVSIDFERRHPSGDAFQMHAICGWDVERSRYALYWFESGGSHARTPALGSWDGERLVFHTKTTGGHHVRCTCTPATRPSCQVLLEHSTDGVSWTPVFEAALQRRR